MRIARYEFSPPLWAVLAFAATFILLLALGFWQIQRGESRAEIIAERTAAGKNSPVALASLRADAALHQRVMVTGRYLRDKQLLLDNQVWQGEPGYQVWTPLRTAEGQLVMVARGWVALGGDRAHPPNPAAPAGVQKIVGVLRHWPEPGIRLGKEVCPQGAWPRTAVYPEFPQVACNYEASVFDGLLLLDPDAEGGLPRDWKNLGMSPLRNYGYALQWFAMAAALCAIFIGVNTRKQNMPATRDT